MSSGADTQTHTYQRANQSNFKKTGVCSLWLRAPGLKTWPQPCIVPVCWTVKYLVIYLWWLNFIIFLLPFSAISIANTERWVGWVVGWGGLGGVGWGGWWKAPHLEHLMSSHDAYTVTNDSPVGHIVSGSKPRSPLPNWHTPWVPLYQLWLWRVGKMPFRKADQLTYNTWYTEDG